MGYDITIGNAVIESNGDDLGSTGTYEAWWTVESAKSDTAPTFAYDGLTRNTNHRAPSYNVWSSFCEEVGLHDLFFKEWYGLMHSHPGTVALKPEHLEQITAAREARAANGRDPGWDFAGPPFGKPEDDDGVRGRDPQLARLLWLEYWVRWALENCERPAIHNG